MSLIQKLADAGSTVPQASSARIVWESGVRYESDGSRVVTLPEMPEMAPEGYREAVESIAGEIPTGMRLRIAEARYDPSAWHRDAQGEQAVTRPTVRYRFVIEPDVKTIPVDELLTSLRKPREPKPVTGTAGALLVCAGDLQLGKPDGDGTAGTIDRFMSAHHRSLDRYRELRKRGLVDDVVLVWAGDCIEGTESQGSRLLARLDCTVTEMVRIYRRLMLEQVQDFARVASKVLVAVVPGNHDEAKRVGDQMATRYDDSWAIEGASAVADTMKFGGYTNVDFLFPDIDGLDVTFDVKDTRIGVLHGHQTRGKMEAWLGAKAVQRLAIGTADVVISGHYHHLKITQLGPTTHIQLPAMDGGSVWWGHKGGLNAPPGMITLIVNDGWRGLEIM